MNRDHSVVFEITSKYCISKPFVDYEGYSVSSKGFLPTVVDGLSELHLPIPNHFSSLIPKMSMFTLAISCLTTSSLFNSWTKQSRFLCNIVLYSIGLYFYHQAHSQLSIISALPSLFILPGSIFLVFSSSIPGHLSTWRVHLSVSYNFAFSYCSWGSQGKNTEVACHSLLQWPTFCQTSPP